MAALNRLYRTTTFRLSVLYFVLFGAAAALAIGYIYWNTNVLLARQLQQTVAAEIQGLAEQYSRGGLPRLAEIVGERSLAPGDSLYLITDKDGRRVSGNLKQVSSELWNTLGPVEFVYRRRGSSGAEQRVGFATVFRLSGGYRLIVGRDIEGRLEFGRVIQSAVLWGLGFMLLAGLFVGWLVSHNLLSRIQDITSTSRTIMRGDLSERIPVRGADDELDRLSGNLNDMFDRIESLMNGLREVSDNIAHDLKTPLTRLRNRVEGALRTPGGDDHYRDALELTIVEADELIKTFNALLSIARLEAGAVRQNMSRIDVTAAVLDMAELYEPVAEEQGMSLEAKGSKALYVSADRQLIGQAIANLIDNALKYSRVCSGKSDCVDGSRTSHGAISIDVMQVGDSAEICVSDRGPGIPEQDRKRALKRFVRLEKSRSAPGSGLGLSLAAAVASLHDGDLRLEDNDPGLKVVIRLPLIQDKEKNIGEDGQDNGTSLGGVGRISSNI